MIYHRSYAKVFEPMTQLCDAGAMLHPISFQTRVSLSLSLQGGRRKREPGNEVVLYQQSYLATGELATLWACNIPIESKEYK